MEYSPTERLGVNATEKIFIKEFKWIFRDQPISDMGIDAHTEIVIDGKATGQLIALQIKTGGSHFSISDEYITYYGDNKHLDYWMNHSLPVIIVAHFPETEKTYWEIVQLSNIERTQKAWKIKIPKSQELSKAHYGTISAIGGGTDEQKRRHKLFLDKSLMEIIREGGSVSVEFDEWLHKSLNRTNIRVFVKTKEEDEYVEKEWGIAYAGYENEEILRLIFPWAEITVDEEFYNINLDEDSLEEMYNLEYLYSKPIYPYIVRSSEMASFRISLKLNTLGNSFLIYWDYVENGEILPGL